MSFPSFEIVNAVISQIWYFISKLLSMSQHWWKIYSKYEKENQGRELYWFLLKVELNLSSALQSNSIALERSKWFHIFVIGWLKKILKSSYNLTISTAWIVEMMEFLEKSRKYSFGNFVKSKVLQEKKTSMSSKWRKGKETWIKYLQGR